MALRMVHAIIAGEGIEPSTARGSGQGWAIRPSVAERQGRRASRLRLADDSPEPIGTPDLQGRR